MAGMDYDSFDQLPNHYKVRLEGTGQSNLSEWVKRPIPALGNRTILETAGDPDADRVLAEFCQRVKCGFP
jgi:hypothetical protein